MGAQEEKAREEAEARRLIDHDDDFVALPKFGNSLRAVMERYPDGVPPHMVAKAMMMPEDDVEELYQRVLRKLRRRMKVQEGEWED